MAGGSQIIINQEGIKIITPAKFEAKAKQHLFEDGREVKTELPILPQPIMPYKLQYLVQDKSKNPIADASYLIMDAEGNIEEGKTDNQGFMNIKTTDTSKEFFTHVITNEIEEAQDAVSEEDQSNG